MHNCMFIKNWTLTFKLLYPLNHINYLNKIGRMCCVNITYKFWKFSYLSWNTEFFSMGWFFLLAHPVQFTWHLTFDRASLSIYTAWWQGSEAHVREQLTQSRYLAAERPGVEPTTSWVASSMPWQLHHQVELWVSSVSIRDGVRCRIVRGRLKPCTLPVWDNNVNINSFILSRFPADLFLVVALGVDELRNPLLEVGHVGLLGLQLQKQVALGLQQRHVLLLQLLLDLGHLRQLLRQ